MKIYLAVLELFLSVKQMDGRKELVGAPQGCNASKASGRQHFGKVTPASTDEVEE
jgi:hypothetical protein